MPDYSNMTVDELIEDTRAHPTDEPWLKDLPHQLGTLLAAMGYLETYAGQILLPWAEGGMNEQELGRFTMISSFKRVNDCTNSIQRTVDALKNQQSTEELADRAKRIWTPLKAFIERLEQQFDRKELGEWQLQ